MRQRLLNLLIALDIFLFCVVCFGNTQIGETASEAAYKSEKAGNVFGILFRPIIDFLFRALQAGHCQSAFEAAQKRAQARLAPEAIPANLLRELAELRAEVERLHLELNRA
jgi:hypothetical protein